MEISIYISITFVYPFSEQMLCSTCDKPNVRRKLKVLGIPILKTKDITPNSIQNEHTKKAATMSMQL